MDNFKPLSNKVLISPDAADVATKGGILLAKQTEDLVLSGIAVAVGPGTYTPENVHLPMQVSEGDKVLFDRRKAIPVELEGKKFYLTPETEILAVL